MSTSFRWFSILLLFLFSVLLQVSGALRLGGVIPNGILVVLLFLAFSSLRWPLFLMCVTGCAIVALLILPFWYLSVVPLLALTVGVRAVRTRMTGHFFVDFSIAMFCVTILIYAFVGYSTFSIAFVPTLIVEICANIFLGGVVWIFLRRSIVPYAKIRS